MSDSISAISGLHAIFSKQKYSNWTELEDEIRNIEATTEKGDAFEQFCYFYFLYHKDIYKIEEVWSDKVPGREIPKSVREKYKLEKNDYGVDGVSLLSSGGVEAWQSKFRSDQSAPTATELATFWTESEYCEAKRTIANSDHLPVVAEKKLNHEQTLLDRLLDLDQDFFDALHGVATTNETVIELPKYSPRPHQQAMLDDVVTGLSSNDRGKLIAACGTGKTLAALWVSENEKVKFQKVVVFAPSISLVGQTVREWVKHRNRDFEYLCVCSDKTITEDIEENEFSDIDVDDLDFNVTTTSEEVAEWLDATQDCNQYIFSTYHSIPVLEAALKSIGDYKFDLAIFDEAHRTVGREDQYFARGLLDENIPAKKRLFMTATERLVNPAVKTYAKNSGVEVFSMDDEDKYGPTFHNFNFGKAIKAGVIADYEIVLAAVSGDDERELIGNNAYLAITDGNEEEVTISSDLLFKAGFLTQTLVSGEVVKVISFHSSRKNATIFNSALEIISQKKSFGDSAPVFTYVLGDQNSSERSVRISNFKEAERGVLGNVQVLSEGVDIPIVDSVYFVDPKKSLIDIVQGVGRALRKPPGVSKTAKVIVPVIVPDEIENLDEIDWDESLATFHAVIQSMRDQDDTLHEEIDQFNEFAVSNGKKGIRLGSKSNRVKVVTRGIKLPKNIALDDFLKKITIRVATANGNPTGSKLGFSHLGKGERKSNYKPQFSILGDYNPDTYRDSLVAPTVAQFDKLNATKNRKDLTINHNNVSHAIRLGVIRASDKDQFELTELGKKLHKEEISFEDVFRNQMMLYTNNNLTPYRLILETLLSVNTLNHFEFLFGPYVIQNSEDIKAEIEASVSRINHIRSHYPNLDLTNLNNRESVTVELNKISPVEIAHNDIWGDRTTLKNKFRFLANHITLFEELEPRKEGYKEPLKIKDGNTEKLKTILKLSDPKNAKEPYGDWYWFKG